MYLLSIYYVPGTGKRAEPGQPHPVSRAFCLLGVSGRLHSLPTHLPPSGVLSENSVPSSPRSSVHPSGCIRLSSLAASQQQLARPGWGSSYPFSPRPPPPPGPGLLLSRPQALNPLSPLRPGTLPDTSPQPSRLPGRGVGPESLCRALTALYSPAPTNAPPLPAPLPEPWSRAAVHGDPSPAHSCSTQHPFALRSCCSWHSLHSISHQVLHSHSRHAGLAPRAVGAP